MREEGGGRRAGGASPVPAAAAELVTRARRSVRDDEGVRFVSRRFRNLWGRKRATLLTEFGSGSGNSGRILNPISMPLQTPEFRSQFQNSDFLAQFCTTKRGARVFEGMRGDYFVSRNFPDRLFTSPGFEGIIPRYPHKSPPL
jgi:hypothetical protein